MPIIDADKARACIAVKRTMSAGFAGVDNELYYAENTLMVFGDAKGVLGELVKELAEVRGAAG
jgi:NAD(P) transhydrogenase subunit beta